MRRCEASVELFGCFRIATLGRVHDVFSEVREASSLAAHSFKAGASEVLSVYPLIRYFLEITIMPRGPNPAETAPFLAVCRVLDLMDTIRNVGVGDRKPKQEVARSLRLHVAAYGCDWVEPKHHYMIHMPRHVEEDGVWLDCFVHVRKHIISRRLRLRSRTQARMRKVFLCTSSTRAHISWSALSSRH